MCCSSVFCFGCLHIPHWINLPPAWKHQQHFGRKTDFTFNSLGESLWLNASVSPYSHYCSLLRFAVFRTVRAKLTRVIILAGKNNRNVEFDIKWIRFLFFITCCLLKLTQGHKVSGTKTIIFLYLKIKKKGGGVLLERTMGLQSVYSVWSIPSLLAVLSRSMLSVGVCGAMPMSGWMQRERCGSLLYEGVSERDRKCFLWQGQVCKVLKHLLKYRETEEMVPGQENNHKHFIVWGATAGPVVSAGPGNCHHLLALPHHTTVPPSVGWCVWLHS